jgi:hypothetical protein
MDHAADDAATIGICGAIAAHCSSLSQKLSATNQVLLKGLNHRAADSRWGALARDLPSCGACGASGVVCRGRLASARRTAALKSDEAAHVSARLARPIFTFARARPTVVVTRPNPLLLMREDMFDRRADLRFSRIGDCQAFRQWPALGFLAMDARYEAAFSDMHPFLMAFFSSSALRCLGATTIVASTICPPMAR